MTTEQLIAEATDAFVDSLRKQLPRDARQLECVDPSRIGAQAADWAASAVLRPGGTSLLARRIGPIYTAQDLTGWLVAPGRSPLTGEAVRKRAKQRKLVAFHADDQQWGFPAWQFDRAAGRLIPRAEVIGLWQQLPHESFLTDADLAAWMNTRLRALDGTPAGYAHANGASDPLLLDAVSRLRARAA